MSLFASMKFVFYIDLGSFMSNIVLDKFSIVLKEYHLVLLVQEMRDASDE